MFDRVLNTPLLVTIFSLPTETKVNVINVKQEGQPLFAGEKPITLLVFLLFFFSEIFHLEPHRKNFGMRNHLQRRAYSAV